MRRLIIILISLLCLQAFTQDNTRKNSIILQGNIIAMTSLSYDRVIPLSQKINLEVGGGVIIGTGFGYGSNGFLLDSGFLFFGPKSYLETGFIMATGFDSDPSLGIKLAYRYVMKIGLILRFNIYFLKNTDPWLMPNIGIGYAF